MGLSVAGDLSRSIAKVHRSLKCKGLRKTLRVTVETILFHLSAWSERRFDRSRNIDTTEIVPIKSLSTLTDNGKFSEDYVPTPLSIIRRSIESLADDLSDLRSLISEAAKAVSSSKRQNMISGESSA